MAFITDPQREYIESLLARSGESVQTALTEARIFSVFRGRPAQVLGELSVQEASDFIDYLKDAV